MPRTKKHMISMVGGGSGGHVMPLVYLVEELLRLDDGLTILVVTDRSYYERTIEIFQKLTDDSRHPDLRDRVIITKIFSGKLRRYNRGLAKELLDLKTQLKNFADLFKVGLGYLQSWRLKLKYRPELIFCKGGYVAIPFCLACRKIPTIVHDSDLRPGLANKFVSRWAEQTIQGLPNLQKPNHTALGIPTDPKFKLYTKVEQQNAKFKLNLDQDKPLILVNGGGLGSESLNELIFTIAPFILEHGASIVHLTGNIKQNSLAEEFRLHLKKRTKNMYKPIEFTQEMPELVKAADLVITRAGATSIQELANAHKPAVIVPAPQLTDQAANAKLFTKEGLLVLNQNFLIEDPQALADTVLNLLKSPPQLNYQREMIAKFARPKSTKQIAAKINLVLSSNTKN